MTAYVILDTITNTYVIDPSGWTSDFPRFYRTIGAARASITQLYRSCGRRFNGRLSIQKVQLSLVTLEEHQP